MPATAVEESEVSDRQLNTEIRQLYTRLVERSPRDATKLVHDYPDEVVEGILILLNPAAHQHVLDALPRPRRELVLVVDGNEHLIGVMVMRDMMLGQSEQTLFEAMLRHYPVYPVVDAHKHIIGLRQGQRLFEQQAVVLSVYLDGRRAHNALRRRI